jgi:hypothetical protein
MTNKTDREWALKPKSQEAVDLMFRHPPMFEEIEIARLNGYINGNKWVPEHKRCKSRLSGKD